MDDEEFSRKSRKYRKTYAEACNGLYGTKPYNPPKLTKIKRSSGKPNIPTEFSIQSSLVKWSRFKGIPLISIPNGGRRTYWTGQKEVSMGLTKGVSDLFLALPSQKYRYHGFWLEMKRPGKKPTLEQYAWLNNMRDQGYMTGWYDDWEVAKQAIEIYLG